MFVKAAVVADDGCDSDDVDETAARSCSRADCGRSILSPTREDGISDDGSTDSWLDQFSTGEAITEMQGNCSFPRMKVQVIVMVVEDKGGLVESCDEGNFGKTRWSSSGSGGESVLPRLPIKRGTNHAKLREAFRKGVVYSALWMKFKYYGNPPP